MKINTYGMWFSILFVAAPLLFISGCTANRSRLADARSASTTNQAAIIEESRALTTGALDSVNRAPTNPPTALARTLLEKNQAVIGVPQKRLPVDEVLAGDKEAIRTLNERLALQDRLLQERADLDARLKDAEARLIDMGAKYEAERNKGIVSRIWHWTIGTLGIGGLIALCIFVPAVLPFLGSFVGWIVGKLPILASWFGVVGKKAFDQVVKGVGNAREALKKTATVAAAEAGQALAEPKMTLDQHLLVATDEDVKKLIEARRAALNV